MFLLNVSYEAVKEAHKRKTKMPIWPKAQRTPEEQIRRNSNPTCLDSDNVQCLKRLEIKKLQGIKCNLKESDIKIREVCNNSSIQ